MADPAPTLDSFEQFFFEMSLYANHLFTAESHFWIEFLGYRHRSGELARQLPSKFDGHCVVCGRNSTYQCGGAKVEGDLDVSKFLRETGFGEVVAKCTRCDCRVRVWFIYNNGGVRKIGQHPSLADIALDEVSPYRNRMSKDTAAEFHKAVGLAAHGVGVGSFVYLRRVFERLVNDRFDEHREAENWDADKFKSLRMDEKVQLLKNHLPAFLVENSRVYSILSLGIHELEEELCLQWFDAMKTSIVIILEDDKRQAEERAMRKQLSNAIKSFDPQAGSQAGADANDGSE